LLLKNILPQDAGRVAVLVSNSYGVTISADAILRVVPPRPLLSLAISNDFVRLRANSLQPDWPYVLFSSTNLQDWIPLQNISSVGTNVELFVPITNNTRMFFRLKDANP